jgi:hypothetical protein
MKLPLILAAAVVASSGCGENGDEGRVPDPNDTTPPGRVAMDAHFPTRDGQLVTVSVSPTSGDEAVVLDNLPGITLFAQARDAESAIDRLEILGETTVHCKGAELGQSKYALWGSHLSVARSRGLPATSR